MANCTDFEGSLVNVDCDAQAFGQPFISQIKGVIVDAFERMKEDNFFHADSGTITGSIENLEKLDKAVRDTNILYNMFPEKEELMKKILQEMQELREKKQQLDPNIIGEACSRYNDNLEAAKYGYINNEMLETANAYNSDNSRPRKRITFKKVRLSQPLPDGSYYVSGDNYIQKNLMTISGDDIVTNIVTRYTIPYGYDEYDYAKDSINTSPLKHYNVATGSQKEGIESVINHMQNVFKSRKIYNFQNVNINRNADTRF